VKERLTTIPPLSENVASQSGESWKKVKTFSRFQWTEVQKFILILQSRAIEGSSCEVEVSVDYRQTVTVGSFITKLNTFNWKIDRLGRPPVNAGVLSSANTNLVISLNVEVVLYVHSTSTVVSGHQLTCEPRTVIQWTLLYNLESN